MLVCAVVLICAFNPSLTDIIAAKVTGQAVQNEGSSAVEITEIGGEQVTSPEPVPGRSGYIPVKGDGEEIADADAQTLEGKLQTGDTGEGLTFDAVFYPYYHMLDQDLQALYRQIYANAQDLTESFAPVVKVSVEEATQTFEAVYNDHPELFWLDTGYSCKYLQNGECVELTLQYHPVVENLESAKDAFDSAAEEILNGAGQFSTDREKEKYVHDALMEKVDYNTTASMGQSAYSALVNGSSVCAGYARAFQYLMIEQRIPCYYCTGYSGGNHAWNIVRVDGNYRNVDVTWDDTDPATYDYYNKSDAEYAATHERKSMSVHLPACNDASEETDSDQVVSGDSNGSTTDETNVNDIDTDSLINPNPQKPLTWFSKEPDDSESDDSEDEETNLEKAGLTEEEVMDDLKEYYTDCKEQMIAVGTGKQQFINAVPKSLWSSIERAYSDESYKDGYVKEALKKLEMQNFAIQLQVEKLDGGYYRLYHNISTW